MFVLSNFLAATAQVVEAVLTIIYWLIIIRALISWVSPDPSNPIVQFLHGATDPILFPFRRILPPPWKLGIDLSPILAILAVVFLKSFVVKTLLDLSLRVG
jgi:YggT family protein